MPADSMKLIAYGKVLEDDTKTLKECAIKEGDFLVVMVAKVILFFRVNIRLAQTSCQTKGRCSHD
jgi:hypothetical protein